jgi:hypothetical protein
VVDCGDRFEVRFSRKLKQSDLKAIDPGFAYLVRPRKNVPGEAPERILRSAISSTTAAESRMYSILGRMRAYSGPNQLLSRYAGMKSGEWERRVWNCLQGETDFVFHALLVQFGSQFTSTAMFVSPRGSRLAATAAGSVSSRSLG